MNNQFKRDADYAMGIIKKLIDNYELERLLECYDYYTRDSIYVKWYELAKTDNFINMIYDNFDYGATKFVLTIPELENWVIKVPFTYLGKDYCRVEYENYEKAKKNKVEYFFAKTVYIGECEGSCVSIPVYLQEKVCCNAEIFDDIYYNYFGERYYEAEVDEVVPAEASYGKTRVDSMEELYEENCADDDRISIIFEETNIDEREIDKLLTFLREYNIDDIHNGNFGLSKDNEIVIVDFSGYNG